MRSMKKVLAATLAATMEQEASPVQALQHRNLQHLQHMQNQRARVQTLQLR